MRSQLLLSIQRDLAIRNKAMQLHTLTPRTKNKSRMVVGRGGKRGKTSGKGTKGQNSRAGRFVYRSQSESRFVACALKSLKICYGFSNTFAVKSADNVYA